MSSPTPPPGWVTRGIFGIILATFLSDAGHEMVTAVLPLYLTTLGLGPGALGLMEGVADFSYSLSKLGGGVLGHRVEHKRPVTALGYALTAISTAAIALTSTATGIGLLRVIAWISRGFRGPLRDFLLADEVATSHYGRAYGLERSADMLGAVVGPLLALALLAWGVPITAVIAVSFAPTLFSAVSILAFTRDRIAPREQRESRTERARLPRRFWLLLTGVLLFGMGDFSRSFLVFLVASAFGGAAHHGALTAGVLAYAAHNVVSGIAAFPAGKLGDRVPKWQVLVGGYVLGVITNLTLAGAGTHPWRLGAAVLGSGIYIAVEETVEKASVAELLPREQRSLGLGILASANAVGDMASSVYVGALLSAGKGALAFGLAATFGAIGALWVLMVGRSTTMS